jgi:hypothetical protein
MLAGCRSSADARDAPSGDECPADLPPPSDPCLEGQCGNERGVGQPCSKGGSECDVFSLLAGEAGICIPDFADNTRVHACSMPCNVDEDCGSGAVCAPDPKNVLSKGCAIVACEGR